MGKSKSKDRATKAVMWALRVHFIGLAPMTCTIRAASLKDAKQIAKQRHPSATKIESVKS